MKKLARISVEELKRLQQFITSDDNPKFFFTMTEINKIGINPRSRYNTPLGIYCYPLTKTYFTKLIKNDLPYAGGKPYINIFTLNVPTFNLTHYTESDLKRDTNKIRLIYGIPIKEQSSEEELSKVAEYAEYDIEDAIEDAKEDNPQTKMWNLTRVFSGNMRNWNHLLRKLGYTNFYDPGTSLIHPGEPTQAVILDPTIIIKIETFYNPHVYPYERYEHLSEQERTMLSQYKVKQEKLSDNIRRTTSKKILHNIAINYLNNVYVVGAIIDNIHTSNETLMFIWNNINSFKDNDSYYIISHFASRKNLSLDIAKEIINSSHLSSEIIRFLFQKNPSYINIFEKQLSTNADENVRAEIAKITDNEKILKQLSQDSSIKVKINILNNPNTTQRIFLKMSSDSSLDVINQICNKELPTTILNNIFDRLTSLTNIDYGSQYTIRDCIFKLAVNKNSGPELLKKIAVRYLNSEDVVLKLLGNTKLDEDTLKILSKSKSYKVLYEITKHKNISTDILKQIIQENEYELMQPYSYFEQTFTNIAKHHNITLDILNKLATSGMSVVVREVINNPKITHDTINIIFDNARKNNKVSLLMKDILDYQEISEDDVLAFISILETDLSPDNIRSLMAIASWKLITDKIANKLLQINNILILSSLAANKFISNKILDILSTKNNEEILRVLAGNIKLSETNIQHVFDGIMSNSNIINKLSLIIPLLYSGNMSQELLAKIFYMSIEEKNIDLLANVLGTNKCPDELFKIAANSDNSKIRLTVATSSYVPIEILEELTKDSDAFVAREARYYLRYRKEREQQKKSYNLIKNIKIASIINLASRFAVKLGIRL